MKRFRIWDYLRSSLWFVPILCVLVGVGLSFATIAIDRSVGTVVPRSLSGDPDAALAILTTVAMSMVTLTGLVLTITMVVVHFIRPPHRAVASRGVTDRFHWRRHTQASIRAVPGHRHRRGIGHRRPTARLFTASRARAVSRRLVQDR